MFCWVLFNDLPLYRLIETTAENLVNLTDAKYYGHTTQTQFGVHTLHSNNLYQIFTYVKNKEHEFGDKPHEVSGMLLYAQTDESVLPNSEYRMSGNRIAVRTLDLNQGFSEISQALGSIVVSYFGEQIQSIY